MMTEIPDGWFDMATCPEMVFVRAHLVEPRGVNKFLVGYKEWDEFNVEDSGIVFGDSLTYFDYWQPIPGVTPAFGPWIDGPPTIDTGLMYRVVLLDEKEYYGRYDVLLNEWDLKENNLWGQLSVDADRIFKLCRAIGVTPKG